MFANQIVETIISLSQKLKSPDTIPHLTITLKEQSTELLKFSIILLRILEDKPHIQSLLELSKNLPATVAFIPERVANVGILLEKYVKEANVFTLEIEKAPFLKKNHSLHFAKAYDHVVQLLEKMIGPFKDCTPLFQPQPVETPDAGSDEKGQTLRLHIPRATLSLDPRIGADRTSGVVIKMLYEGLCRLGEGGQVELAIAQQVALSEDKKTYTFTLRETQWSNGSPLTAYDFEYAWKTTLEPDLRAPYSFLFFPIKEAEAVKRGEKPVNQVGIRALDDLTLQVQLEYPTPHFLELTANWIYSPLCREIDQKSPGWAFKENESYICNGPFKLSSQKTNDSAIQVVKNPRYWDAQHVKLDQINIFILENEAKGLERFDNKELDWVGDPISKIPPTYIPKLQKNKSLLIDQHNFGLFWLQLNLNLYPFQNANIRKALAYGTNRKELIKDTLHSDDIPAFGFRHRPELTFKPIFQDGDTELALRHFHAGLKELNASLEDLPPIIFCHSEIEEQQAISHAIGKQWNQLFGIKVHYEKLLWNSYFNALHRNDLMIGGMAWYPRVSDPLYFYDLFVFKEHAVKVTSWKNGPYSKLIQEAKHTLDLETKERLLAKAEKILLDAMPVIPLFYQYSRYVKSPSLKGYILSNTNQIDFRSAYIEESHA